MLIWPYAFISPKEVPRNRMAGSYGRGMIDFSRNCQTVLQCGCTSSHYPQQSKRVLVPLLSCQYLACIFNFSPFTRWVMISYGGFNLHFPYDQWRCASFCLVFCISVKCLFKSFACFLESWVIFLILTFESSLHILNTITSSDKWIANIFFQSVHSLNSAFWKAVFCFDEIPFTSLFF